MPADDIDDNPNAVEPTASAPSLEKMDAITGYSNVGFSGGMITSYMSSQSETFVYNLQQI